MEDGKKIVIEALKRLRKRREELELSQAELAEKAGVNPSYVGLLERGERVPSLEVLAELTAATGVSLSDIFTETPKRKVSPEAAAIATIIEQWPVEHRKTALRIFREMDRLRSVRPGSSRSK